MKLPRSLRPIVLPEYASVSMLGMGDQVEERLVHVDALVRPSLSNDANQLFAEFEKASSSSKDAKRF